MKKFKLKVGNNIEILKSVPDNSIDSIVTDPPYGLNFMNKKWDYDVPSVEFWKEAFRVLKPGGHVLSFGGTRTYHRMVVNIEDAGFEIRDQIMWLYGSGFPKSHNIGKSVDKIQGNERQIIGENPNHRPNSPKDNKKGDYNPNSEGNKIITKGTSPYEGWGTALKPANEPICVARKPLSEKSIAENVLKWRTGGINIDGCRISTDDKLQKLVHQDDCNRVLYDSEARENGKKIEFFDAGEGRFPANLILDEVAAQILDEQSGISKSSKGINSGRKNGVHKYGFKGIEPFNFGFDDKGGASRFFYTAKVSKKERNLGLESFEEKIIEGRDVGQDERSVAFKARPSAKQNIHPTVKPVNLMAYLCRLVTPENGIILDPYMGSGSTGIAALCEGFKFYGIEMDNEYMKIAKSRIENYEKYKEFIK